MSFKVKLWGVRGSIACPSAKYVAYGGNTSCIEVALGGRRIILDCGTGLRNLGQYFTRKGAMNSHILLTHTHWDHINGFPFFTPAYMNENAFTVMAGHLWDKDFGVQEVLAGHMSQPTFPVPLDIMAAKLDFVDFEAGEDFDLGQGIKVKTCKLNHPDNATGYRIEYRGSSLCYITDTEHVVGKPDQNILGLIEGADLVIYDSTYTDNEFKHKIGWGHSTWQEGIRLCHAANVGRLAIFHHDPDHEDPFMEQLEAEARYAWSGAFIARENMRIFLSR